MRATVLAFALLLVAGCSGAEPSDMPEAEEGELRRARLLATSAVASKADASLLAAVRSIESAGAEGGWFESTFPIERAPRAYFYLLQKVPARADMRSGLFLLRLEHSRAALAEAIAHGTPIVLGAADERYGAAAATFRDLPIASDALSAVGARAKTIVFVTPKTLRTTLAHELQHWSDFEDAAYRRRYAELASAFIDARYLTADDKLELETILIELRGHGMGEKQARDDLAHGRPALARDGSPVAPDALGAAYEGDIATQVNVFLSEYRPSLRAIEAKVKSAAPGDHAKLAKLFDTLNVAPAGSRLAGLVRPQ